MPSRDDLTLAWGDHVLAHLPAGARALYKSGRFVDVDGEAAVYALPNAMHRDRCESKRVDVESVLASHFGRPVALRLVVADEGPADTPVTAVAGEPATADRGGSLGPRPRDAGVRGRRGGGGIAPCPSSRT